MFLSSSAPLGIRGGISQCNTRYASANNKFMEEYDSKEKSSFLMYLDANNLYGYAMMQSLPICGFKWHEDHDEFNTDKILELDDDADVGYIFEVDLDYPAELHDMHNDYPFCAEKMQVPGAKSKIKKLLLTLNNKRNYVIHYRMLKLALQHGLKLKKVHRVLTFMQDKWLKPYIDLNTKMRTNSKNEFEKKFYKLMANAVYGKTMENVRCRKDIHLVRKWEGRYGAQNYIAQPNFKRCIPFNENFVAIEMSKTNIMFDKPLAVGMSVLDISKTLMYYFYYNHLKQMYEDKVSLLYTDTDSFIIEVETDCFYADMKENLNLYDTSDFPSNNIYGMPLVNKKIPGLFKDELNGEIFTKFVGLRSKMYSVLTGNIEKMKKAKGVKRSVLKKQISFTDYLECLMIGEAKHVIQNTFRSKGHEVFTITQEKVGLSAEDDKRIIDVDNIHTYSYGHYKYT